MRSRIGTRLILGTGLVSAATIGAIAVLVVRAHRADLMVEVSRGANQLSEAIKRATHEDMLENRRESLSRQIEALGRQPGIESVRVYNKEGRVVFSAAPQEVGRSVDKRAEACYACHAVDRPLERLPITERSRVFQGAGGTRVLGLINPIQNQPGCAGECHVHSPRDTVLGVLDVAVSLADVDQAIAGSQRRMALLAGSAIAASALILWWLNRRLVLRPVEALALGTRRVAEGDLATTIPVSASHELGDLARAFNDMTRRLVEAQRQITQADKLASVGRLAAGVAHEINNPLTGVLTYSSLLLKRADPEARADLEVIVRETKRCRDIVRGLLEFARQTPPRRQPTDLNEVVRRSVAILMNQLSLHRVALDLDLAEGLAPLSADANQLQQVIVNLLVNAVDAVGEGGGRIRLATRQVSLPPWGHAVIREAACPSGCALSDASLRIGGLPAIRVSRSCRGREGLLQLDPVYGRFNQVCAEPCEEGVSAVYSCPRCRTALAVPEVRCQRCGAEAFGVSVPDKGRVVWCSRNGCHWSSWPAAEAAGEQPALEVAVEDTGRGIAATDLPHLFEPFFTTKGHQGTGLGLAVTWGIVEGHGGTIDVTSQEGQGSRFLVRLPLAGAAERPRAA